MGLVPRRIRMKVKSSFPAERRINLFWGPGPNPPLWGKENVYYHTLVCHFIGPTYVLIEWMLFSCSVVSGVLRHHRLQHARLPCPSPSPKTCSNSHPLSQWCHPTISSSVVLFSSCLQCFPTLRSFPMNQFFASSGQSIGASASVLPMSIQGWSLECNGLEKKRM